MAPNDAHARLLRELGDSIDNATFEQILEMDEEDDEREFSKSIVFGFFEQCQTTFEDIERKIKERDLEALSSLGHYLKGSSATLGLTNMKNSCEKIQHLGKGMDETGQRPEKTETCLRQIQTEYDKLRADYQRVEAGLQAFFK